MARMAEPSPTSGVPVSTIEHFSQPPLAEAGGLSDIYQSAHRPSSGSELPGATQRRLFASPEFFLGTNVCASYLMSGDARVARAARSA